MMRKRWRIGMVVAFLAVAALVWAGTFTSYDDDTTLEDTDEFLIYDSGEGTGDQLSNVTWSVLRSEMVTDSGLTQDTEWDTEAEVETAWGGANIIVATEIDTSSELATILGDETGSGAAVFATSPSLTTPDIGAATGTSLTLTGDLSGNVPVTLDTAATVTLTAADCRGGIRINNDNDVIDYTLPAAAAGLSVTFYSRYAAVVTVDTAYATDTIILDGTALTAGNAIDSAGGAGDFISLLALDASTWITLGRSGTWVDGGAD